MSTQLKHSESTLHFGSLEANNLEDILNQEFASAKTLSAFALGLALFITTLALNAFALYIVRKYREEYD